MSLPQPAWALLPLRGFLTVVFLYAGISKIADRHFLDGHSPSSIHAQVLAVKAPSPIGSLLGPVADHSFAFGLLMALAELAVGLGLLLGLLTRIAAAGGMVLSLSLWLTVSWQAQPWFTSADVVYLFALTPVLLGGAPVLSLDAWLADARERHPGVAEDRTRRALLVVGAAVVGAAVAGAASLFRRAPASNRTAASNQTPSQAPSRLLTRAADVPVGGATQVRDPASGQTDWVLQLQPGQFTAFDATCPHEGCTVAFDSASSGFTCPCHGSRFDPSGKLLAGPATSGLTPVPVKVAGGEIRST